jgi:hypothetical protein
MVNLGDQVPISLPTGGTIAISAPTGVAVGTVAEDIWMDSIYPMDLFTVQVWVFHPRVTGYVAVDAASLSTPPSSCGFNCFRASAGVLVTKLADLTLHPDAPGPAGSRGNFTPALLAAGDGLAVSPAYNYYFVGVSNSHSAEVTLKLLSSVPSDDTTVPPLHPPVIPPGTPDVPPADPDIPVPPYVDPHDPGKVLPARGHGQANPDRDGNLLDLIREFSKEVGRAVRLTGVTRISMVNPAEAMPAGWTNDTAEDLYSQGGWSSLAGAPALNVSALDLSGTATLVTDDVGLVASTWKLPAKLPVRGLEPTRVQRVSYTFTPEHFTGTVEFSFTSIPDGIRRT